MVSDENEIVGMPHVFGLCGSQHNITGTIFFNTLGQELHSVFIPSLVFSFRGSPNLLLQSLEFGMEGRPKQGLDVIETEENDTNPVMFRVGNTQTLRFHLLNVFFFPKGWTNLRQKG